MYDVAIIGAGVIGGLIARRLASYALRVCLLEKENDVAMGATRANSAIVHAGFDAKVGSLKAKLNVKGSEMMPDVARELGVKYIRNGSLVVGFDEADRAHLRELYERGCANGVKGLALIDRERLVALEPNISDEACCALYAPTGAIICPYELAIAAIGNAMDNGVALKCGFEVKEISDLGDHFELCSGDESIRARYVVNAAGLFSDDIAAMASDEGVHVQARRGEYVLLDKECGRVVSHTIFCTPSRMGKGILVSPTVDGNLIVGPTAVDTPDKECRDVSPEFFNTIRASAARSVKNIPMGKMITSFCGLRAVGNTGDFIINVPRARFVNAAGIESPGLSASPAIAEYVCELLHAEGLVLTARADFDPIRPPMHAFREADTETKNQIIQKDPSYGRIVCRCETVSEGEILAAIRRNPRARDMDGVKRRTRAQMGRCQGGFCAPYIMELLAREWGVPYEQITKFGKGSYMISGKTKEDVL